MKILQVMYFDKKFTYRMISFYNKFFNQHNIIVINAPIEESERLNTYDNIILKKVNPHSLKDNFQLYKIFSEFDIVVLHSLNISTILQFYLIHTKTMKKIVWIEWGKDIYNWQSSSKNILKRCLFNKINCIFRENIRYFIAIFPPDIDVFKNIFKKSNAKVLYAPYTGYPNPYKGISYCSDRRTINIKGDKSTVYIQIGHSATRTLNHIEVLLALEKFKNENIKIILPLSYGDREYASEVEELAKKIFGEKVICLRDFLPAEEYFSIINKASICIFNTMRQCGLGNIHNMIFNDVKLFMPENSVMYKYFYGRGIPIYSFDKIRFMNFQEFSKDIQVKNRKKFNNFVEELLDYDSKVKLWSKIYDTIELESSNNH